MPRSDTVSVRGLLRQRRFWPLLVTHFVGALNDNVLKNALIILISFRVLEHGAVLVNLAAGLFILPFLLLSGFTGQLADRRDKAAIIRRTRQFEIANMLLAALGFAINSVPLLMGVVFLAGSQAAFFSPIKYSILPQHLRAPELVTGNALLEFATYLAILAGTVTGGLLVSLDQEHHAALGTLLLALAVIGLAISRWIPAAPPSEPDVPLQWHPLRTTAALIRHALSDRAITQCIAGIAGFWFVATVLVTQFPNFTRLHLYGNARVATCLLAVFAIGTGLGALASKMLSRGRITPQLVPLGASGVALATVALGLSVSLFAPGDPAPVSTFLSRPGAWAVVFILLTLSASAGIYVVQLYAMVQSLADPRFRSRVIAANNVISASCMVVAAAFAGLTLATGMSIAHLFLLTGALTGAMTLGLWLSTPLFRQRSPSFGNDHR